MDYKKYLKNKVSNSNYIRKLVLFGSRAKGLAGKNSDLDILVVTDKDNDSFTKRYAKVSMLFEPRVFSMDILVKTYDEYKNRLKINDPFIREIENTGKIVYER
jgi:predicted nucleotidyltransferase